MLMVLLLLPGSVSAAFDASGWRYFKSLEMFTRLSPFLMMNITLEVLDETGLEHALALSQRLRAAGLNVETQLEARKLGKQMQYADKAGIRFVVMRGEDEAARGVVTVKDLRRGEQFEVVEAELASALLVEREQLRGAAGAV